MFGDREENNLVEAEFINQNLEADFGFEVQEAGEVHVSNFI